MRRFLTRTWQAITSDSGGPGDPDFTHESMREIRAYARPIQTAYALIMHRHKGQPAGIEFRHHMTERWAFVLRNVSSPEPWRIQYFDARGFGEHACFNSLDEAVEEMVREGFREEDRGALDRAAARPAWGEGQRWLDEKYPSAA